MRYRRPSLNTQCIHSCQLRGRKSKLTNISQEQSIHPSMFSWWVHENTTPSCLILMVQAASGGWGTLHWHVPTVSKRESSNHQCYCQPSPSLYDHSVPLLVATFSRATHHVTKLQSSQTGLTGCPWSPALNQTMCVGKKRITSTSCTSRREKTHH